MIVIDRIVNECMFSFDCGVHMDFRRKNLIVIWSDLLLQSNISCNTVYVLYIINFAECQFSCNTNINVFNVKFKWKTHKNPVGTLSRLVK